jgi:hypothetical protein
MCERLTTVRTGVSPDQGQRPQVLEDRFRDEEWRVLRLPGDLLLASSLDIVARQVPMSLDEVRRFAASPRSRFTLASVTSSTGGPRLPYRATTSSRRRASEGVGRVLGTYLTVEEVRSGPSSA